MGTKIHTAEKNILDTAHGGHSATKIHTAEKLFWMKKLHCMVEGQRVCMVTLASNNRRRSESRSLNYETSMLTTTLPSCSINK